MNKEKPNEYVPFSIARGCTYNNKCPCCGSDTWMSENPYQTLYNGYVYTDNIGKIVGVLKMDDGVYCEKCFEESFEGEMQ
jgi:hypothetical protein